MADGLLGKPRQLLTRQNYLEWNRDWLLCLSSYGSAGEEIINQKYIIDFMHKPSMGEEVWQIVDIDDEETWVKVPMTESHRKQVPSRLASWKNEHEKYKKAKGALINNIINSIDDSLKITIMNQPSYNEVIMKADEEFEYCQLFYHLPQLW
jgi:isopenicillin N synthase-like dioxygenase